MVTFDEPSIQPRLRTVPELDEAEVERRSSFAREVLSRASMLRQEQQRFFVKTPEVCMHACHRPTCKAAPVWEIPHASCTHTPEPSADTCTHSQHP